MKDSPKDDAFSMMTSDLPERTSMKRWTLFLHIDFKGSVSPEHCHDLGNELHL